MTRVATLLVSAAVLCAAGCAPEDAGRSRQPELALAPAAALLPAAAPTAPNLAPSRTLWDEPQAGEAPQAGGGNDVFFGLVATVKPLVKLERTDGPAGLRLDDGPGYELGLLVAEDDMMGRFSLSYTLMEEKARDDCPVHAYWLDWSGGYAKTFWDGPIALGARWEAGVSFLFIDYEKGTYDTFGLGAVGRMAVGAYTEDFRFGLELSGDARGYAGLDSHGFQTGWGYSLGISLLANF
ncbi:MAG: hypothetical protein ACYTGB_01835 [Planctomycetota bacterium]